MSFREGQTATHKDGRKIVYREGAWRLMQGAAAAAAGGARPGKLSVQEQKALINARQAARQAESAAGKAGEFAGLNREQATGGWRALPGVASVLGATSADYGTMNSITNQLAPQMREPGSGAMSDRDVQMFKRSVPNIDFPGKTNDRIVRRIRSDAASRAEYADFLDRWAAERGTLVGADAAYRQRKAAPATGRAAKALPARPKPAGQMSNDELRRSLGL